MSFATETTLRVLSALTTARDDRGQATVEAAFSLPVVFLLLLMLAQPAIVLYDRIVMENAAAESCRMLTTAGSAEKGTIAEDCVRRRLASIPQVAWFHVHDGECSYKITLSGGESAKSVEVTIKNELAPLPLIDGAATLFGATNNKGHLVITVTKSLPTQPSWVRDAMGDKAPDAWIGAWHD